MFTSQYNLCQQSQTSQQASSSIIQTYQGVNLTNFNCHKLSTSQLQFHKYKPQELHYVVDALQKGLKPHTQIGLKRLRKKNNKQSNTKLTRPYRQTSRKLLIPAKDVQKPKPLIIQSPQQLCMKALRTKFLTQLQSQQNYKRDNKSSRVHRLLRGFTSRQKNQKKIKSPKIIRKKLNQRLRRNQLIKLVKKYEPVLKLHFGTRLKGYGNCPKISRKEIKDYLISIGITPDIGPAKCDPQVFKLIAMIMPKQAELILGRKYLKQSQCQC